MLRIIAGLESADEGELLFFGDSISGVEVRERKVGFVFQHYALFKHMTVFENIAFGLRIKPKKQRLSSDKIKEKVDKLLSLVQLEALGQRYPSQLSGGQRQRVALARALAIEPKVLLLDEPFGALDAKVRKELRQWLRKLHDDLHITSVFVTHDVDEALEVADRVVIMKDGCIEQIGTPEEVYHQPKTPFVYKFMGNVNLFKARLDGTVVHLDGSEREAETVIYVRPHLLDIHCEKPHQDAFIGTVHQMSTAGPVAKVELLSQSGEFIQVDLDLEKFKSLGLVKDQSVFVTIKESKTFMEDYSI